MAVGTLGQNTAGEVVVFLLGSDGTLWQDSPATGLSVFEHNVQTLLQTVNSAAMPCPVFLQSGQLRDSLDDNPADVGTIDLGGTITQIAQGRNAAGQQVIYALARNGTASNGTLIEITPTGSLYFPGVEAMIQSQNSACVPIIYVLTQSHQLYEGTPGSGRLISGNVYGIGLMGLPFQQTPVYLTNVTWKSGGILGLFQNTNWRASVYGLGNADPIWSTSGEGLEVFATPLRIAGQPVFWDYLSLN
jgi:hypothetical protein